MAESNPDFSGFSGAGCDAESWAPEVLSFYGDSAAVLSKLDKFEMSLPRRRVFFFIKETNGNTEGAFFERSKEGRFNVKRWKGGPADELKAKLHHAIIENKGVACVGEQTKAILKTLPDLKDEGDIPAPASARAAFGHQIAAAAGVYQQTTVYLMC